MGIKERKKRERERRRQQILLAAKRVFSVKGFSKATMEDIAKEAELSPGTLYLYFKNRDELFASLSLRILQYLNIRLEHLLNDLKTASTQEKIRELKKVMYDLYKFDPLMLVNMFHLHSGDTLKNLTPQLLDDIRGLLQHAIDNMACIFAEGREKGVVIAGEPRALAGIFWALFSGVLLWEETKNFLNEGPEAIQQSLEVAFAIFEEGVTL